MLPRIKCLDDDFSAAIRAYIRARSRSRGILRQIGSHVVHEGHSNSIKRNPLDNEFTKMKEAAAEIRMSFSELELVDANYIVGKANEIAGQFERQFSTNLFQTMDDTTKQTGLRFDGGGKPLTNEAIIEILSAMHMDFDESGKPTFSIVTSPAMAGKLGQLQDEFDKNPSLQKRWEDMMERKRDEFRTREINRNLAG
jgi:hypothetical protein